MALLFLVFYQKFIPKKRKKMQNNDFQPRDYSEFYLKAKKQFRYISEAVNKKRYAMKQKNMPMNAM